MQSGQNEEDRSKLPTDLLQGRLDLGNSISSIDSIVFASDVDLLSRNSGFVESDAGANLVAVVERGIDVSDGGMKA